MRVIDLPLPGHAKPSLAGVEAAGEFFAPVFGAAGKGNFAVALCDVDALAFTLLSYPGCVQLAEFPLQPLLHQAVTRGCAGIVVAHDFSRPWGKPIVADLDLADRLLKATESLNITLLDYLLFGQPSPFSFRRAGIL